jgi:hypothetical protein
MSRTFTRTITVELPPDETVELLIDAGFQEEKERAQDALEASFREVSREGDRLVAELHVTQHARGKTGIDRSRTEQAVTTYEWDLGKRTASWTYKDPHSDRVTVRGTTRVEPDGARSRVRDEIFLEVRVPLIGGQIEKLIIKEIEKGWPRYEQVVRRHVAKRKG